MSAGGTHATAGLLGNRSRAALFLCYHSVADGGPPFASVPVALFERQLAVLRRLGYRTGDRAELERIAAGRRSERRVAFLSFDDGFADNATVVAPLLRALGWTAQVFILPRVVDDGGALRWAEVRERHAMHPEVMRSLDWTAVEAMAGEGIEFGSHTNDHRRLTALCDADLRAELQDSRRQIAERLGSCDMLAYPFGDWDGRVAAAAADVGYRFAFTLPSGSQLRAAPLSIPRIPVDHRDDERRFALKVSSLGRTLLLSPAKKHIRALRALADRGGFCGDRRSPAYVRDRRSMP
jgi:peptidoglycan/xylan/chitin deacetylase (PgdA/CDA1 family)